MMEKRGCKIIVTGKVQGVGFRYFTFKEASRLGVTGHAKNLLNGDVEVLLYGDSEKIDVMLKWLRKGPKTSQVDGIAPSEINYINQKNFVCY